MQWANFEFCRAGLPDPVNDTYEDTGLMYDSVVDFMLRSNDAYLVIATHNESSARRAADAVREIGIGNISNRVVFGQIYGMAEQITMPLGK